MWNMNHVTSIHYKKGYVFHIEFDNGVAGDIDFAEYLNKGPVFLPLRDKELFRQAAALSLGPMVLMSPPRRYTRALFSSVKKSGSSDGEAVAL